MKNLMTILLLISFNYASFAATLTWTGAAGNMNFIDAGNWDSTPGAIYTDDYIIPLGYTTASNPVILNNGFPKSLTLNGAHAAITADNFYMYGGALILDNFSELIMCSSCGMFNTGDGVTQFGIEVSSNSRLVVDGNLWMQNYLNGISISQNSVVEINSGALLRVQSFFVGTQLDLGILINSGQIEYAIIGSGVSSGVSMMELDNGSTVENYGIIIQKFNANSSYCINGIIIDDRSEFENHNEIIIGSVEMDAIHVKNTNNTLPESKFINIAFVGNVYAYPCTGGNCNPSPNAAVLLADANTCFDLQLGSTLHAQVNVGDPTPMPNHVMVPISQPACMMVGGNFNLIASNPPMNLNNLVMGALSRITGVGVVNNINMSTVGFISPGNSPGIITFTQDYNNAGSTFEMEVAGLGGAGATDGHDQIIFQGATNSVNGVDLNLSFIDGVSPQVGDMYTIVSGPVSGTFSSLTFPDETEWDIHYNANDITLELTAIIMDGNVGVGTLSPDSRLHVKGGDLYVETINSGLILKATDGACFRIIVETDGSLSTVGISCPN